MRQGDGGSGKVDIWSTQQRYSVIYADPPWSYVQGGRGAAKKHYATMATEEIENLPVKRLADADCTLFLWVTFPNLKQGLSTIEAWGFQYKTIAFNWVKKTKRGRYFWGCGHWTRSNSEVCLLAVKGTPKRVCASVHSVIDSEVREHSQKPEEARTRIVQLMGDVPRIELFAREHAPGWDCWGNEV